MREIIAMVTPFVPTDNYDPKNPPRVDYDRAKELALVLIQDQGVDGLVVAGTTGSAATLQDEEQLYLFEAVSNVVSWNQIICGTGSNDTEHLLRLTQGAWNLGANRFLVVTPYYNKTSQEGLYDHFATLLNEFKESEFIMYCVQGRTSQITRPETVVRLARDFPNLVGIKDADGVEHTEAIWKKLRESRPDFRYLSGNDEDTFRLMFGDGSSDRGCGFGEITVIGHLFAKERKLMMESPRELAERISLCMEPLSKLLMSPDHPNPHGIRYLVGQHLSEVRQDRYPQFPISEDFAEELDRAYDEAKSDLGEILS